MLEENVADFGRISEILLTKEGKVMHSVVHYTFQLFLGFNRLV